MASQVSSRCSSAVLAASPASFQPSNAAIITGSTSVGTSSADPASATGLGSRVGHRSSLRRDGAGGTGAPAVTSVSARRPPRRDHATSGRRFLTPSRNGSWSPTARWAPCSRRGERGDLVLDDFAASRAATRSSTSPARTWSPASTRLLPAGATPWRPTRSARTCPTSPSTGSPNGSASSPRRAPGSPGRSPTRSHRRPAAVGARLGRARHEAAHAGARDYARLRDAYTEAARGCSPAAPTRCWSRPARTCCRPRPRSSGQRAMAAGAGGCRSSCT